MNIIGVFEALEDCEVTREIKEEILEGIVDNHLNEFNYDDQRTLLLYYHLFSGKGYNCSIKNLTGCGCIVKENDTEYYVLDDDEADVLCDRFIDDSLWSFDSDFLSSVTGFDKSIFEALNSGGEKSNEAIRALIDSSCGIHNFFEKARNLEDRGHFIASDGVENELYIGDHQYFYIYKK